MRGKRPSGLYSEGFKTNEEALRTMIFFLPPNSLENSIKVVAMAANPLHKVREKILLTKLK